LIAPSYLRLLQKVTRCAGQWDAFDPWLGPRITWLRNHYAKKMPPLEVETTFDNGIRLRACLSSHIEAQLFWQGAQEADRSAVNWLKRLLPEDGVFLDIGANIGSFTLVAAKRAPFGKVHAFEPCLKHLERLNYNVLLNGFTNIYVNSFALSDVSGQAVLHIPEAKMGMSNSGGASLYRKDGKDCIWRPETVHTVRLDEYRSTAQIARLDLVKMDVEGGEVSVLRGGMETFGSLRPAVIQEINLEQLRAAGRSADQLLAIWKCLNYRVEVIKDDDHLSPIESVADLRNHQNVLCTPRKS
jgi:FkbM family methyltransferase